VRAAAPFLDARADGLFVDGEPHRFHQRPHGAGRVRMRQHDAVHAGGQHLMEHPRIGTHRRFIGPVHRHVDDHRRRAMAAPGRTAGHQPSHVVGEALDVVRSVLHVVAQVIGAPAVFDACFVVPAVPEWEPV
jgi:hypothetical protein